MWGSDPLLFGKKLWNYDYPLICRSPIQGYTTKGVILHLHPSYLSRCGSFFISLIMENFSTNLQVILIDSHSVNCFVILVWWWEEVSPGSSYSAILAILPSSLNCIMSIDWRRPMKYENLRLCTHTENILVWDLFFPPSFKKSFILPFQNHFYMPSVSLAYSNWETNDHLTHKKNPGRS